MALTTEKCKLTPEGGIAVLMTADAAIAIGEVVCAVQTGTAGRVAQVPTSGADNDMPIGVAYTAATAAGQTFWVVVSGIVSVLPEAGVTATQGYVAYTSGSTAGRVAIASTVPVAATHFKEVGHYLGTATAAGIAQTAVVHFN